MQVRLFGSMVAACVARSNQSDGIHVGGDCTVRGNTCVNNGLAGDGAGIHVNSSDSRIEDNLVTDNDLGIDVDGVGNLIIRNSTSGNTPNYSIVNNNIVGQILNFVGGGTVTSGNPWANFEF